MRTEVVAWATFSCGGGILLSRNTPDQDCTCLSHLAQNCFEVVHLHNIKVFLHSRTSWHLVRHQSLHFDRKVGFISF